MMMAKSSQRSSSLFLVWLVLAVIATLRVVAGADLCTPIEMGKLENILQDLRSEIQDHVGQRRRRRRLLRDNTGRQRRDLQQQCRSNNHHHKKAILIGIDGLRGDAAAMLPLPNIQRLMAMGTWSFWARIQGTEKPWSGPGWSSLLTGHEAKQHLVSSNNDMTDIVHPTVLKTVKDALGTKVAAAAAWHPIIDKTIVSFDGSTLDASLKATDDTQVAKQTVDWILNGDFGLIFSYYVDVDETGHKSGFDPYKPEYRQAVMDTDAHVGKILDAIAKRNKKNPDEEWLIVLTSDHGGQGKGHYRLDNEYIRRIPLIVAGNSPRLPIGPSKNNNPGNHMDVLPTIHYFFGIPIPAGLDGKVFGFDVNAAPPPRRTPPRTPPVNTVPAPAPAPAPAPSERVPAVPSSSTMQQVDDNIATPFPTADDDGR